MIEQSPALLLLVSPLAQQQTPTTKTRNRHDCLTHAELKPFVGLFLITFSLGIDEGLCNDFAFQPPHQKSPDSNRIPRRPHPTTSPSLPMITTEHTSTPTQDHVTSVWFLACTHLTSPHKTSGCSSCQWRGLLLRLEPATSLAVGT